MSARKRHAVLRSEHDVADAPEKSCHHPDDGAICRWPCGIKPLAVEVRFQADQGRHVVWVRSLEWCPPLLALLRGRARAKIVHPQAVFAHVTIAVALVACKTYLHMQQPEENTGLSEAFLLSGWILYLTSSLLLPACSFHWLVRLGSLLVGGTILLRHDDDIGVVSKCVFCCCCCSTPHPFWHGLPARNPTHPPPFHLLATHINTLIVDVRCKSHLRVLAWPDTTMAGASHYCAGWGVRRSGLSQHCGAHAHLCAITRACAALLFSTHPHHYAADAGRRVFDGARSNCRGGARHCTVAGSVVVYFTHQCNTPDRVAYV